MTTPRRRVLRPISHDAGDGVRERKLADRRLRLATERQSLDRWMTRLMRWKSSRSKLLDWSESLNS